MAKRKSRKRASRRRPQRPSLQLEQLDARILLDAHGLAVPQGFVEPSPAIKPTQAVDVGRQVIFVDGSLASEHRIAGSLADRSDVAVVPLYSDRDGLQQMVEYLQRDAAASSGGIQAIHIVSHGNAGQIHLGNAAVTAAKLDTTYRAALHSLQSVIADDGDILFYGCNLASDGVGQAFLAKFAELSGADVAASNDVTGSTPLADWDLESTTGEIRWDGQVTQALADAIDGELLFEIATGTDSSGAREVFLRGNFTEVGIRDQGTFGTQSMPPAGWHPRNNNTTTRLGFVANPQMNNWATQDGDFFAPGTPVESFMIEVNGTSGPSLVNGTSGDIEQNPGSLGVPRTTTQCGQNSVSVDWTGTSHGVLAVERTYTVLEDGLFILMETTLTNTSASTLTDVYFAHNVDPDNDVTIGAGYATRNTIESQPSGTTNLAHVSATQTANDGSYVALVAEDPRARVAHRGFDNRDASNIWNGIGFSSAVGATRNADEAIAIAFRFNTIAPGASVNFKYVYILADGAAITNTFDCLQSPSLDLDGNNSSGSVITDGYKGYFPVGGAAVSIADSDVAIVDDDFSNIQRATVTLTNAQPGDVLSAATSSPSWPAGIVVNGASTSSNIILNGSASVTAYEQALQLIRFSNGLAAPSQVDRTIQVQVEDVDAHVSNVAISTICISDVRATKEQIGTPVRNAANPDYWDVTFQLTIENTGNGILTGLDLVEALDAPGNFGAGFVSANPVSGGNLVFSGSGTAPTVNTSWNGAGVANLLSDDGLLNPGDSFTLDFTATLDLLAMADPETATNQATVSADDPNNPTNESFLSDASDSGSTPGSTNDGAPGATPGNENDPTPLILRDIEVTKAWTATAPAASGTNGNFDVTYVFTVENSGTERLSNLSLTDNLAAQFGGAQVGVVSVTVNNVSATNPPAANAAYNGTAGSDLLVPAAANDLRTGESFQVVLVVELDPDNALANYNVAGQLANSATAQATSGVTVVTDLSDDPANSADVDSEGDNEADDPTGIYLGALEVTKTASTVTPASLVAGSSGTAGHFVVDFTVTVFNRGNDLIDNLSLVENLASQYGGAFVQTIGVPTIAVTNNSGVAGVAANPAGFNGGTVSELFNTATSQLGRGDQVQVVVRVEVDPDAATAALTGGRLENSATASGTGSSGLVIADVSDDPTNATNVDPNNDNNPDDPTSISIADLAAFKSLTSIVPSGSGVAGNFDVTYLFRVTNTGTETLSQLSLTDNFASQFGGAFVGVIGLSVSNVDATTPPVANAGYNGLAGSNLLVPSAADDVGPGQSFEVSLTIEVDPDNGLASYNASGELQNIATASGVGEHGGLPVGLSDNVSDPTDADSDSDGHPNDPTTLLVADMSVTKSFVASGPASSGTAGNFDITYDLTIVNTGNDPLSALSLTDDLFADMGTAFVGIVLQAGQPATLQGGSITDNPEWNAAFDGNSAGVGDAEIIDNSGGNTNLLGVGESLTIRIIAEIDPDAAGAVVAGGYVSNQATATAAGTAVVISQLSDDPSDSTDANTVGDNDPEDVTRVLLSDITLEKSVVGTPSRQADGTWNVSFAVAYRNTGTSAISNLMLMDDLSSASNFGAAWLSTTAVSVDAAGVTSGVAPGLNAAWQVDPTVNVFDGTGSLEPGDEVVVNFSVNIDPDISGSTAGGITNQARGTGTDTQATLVADFSDDPSNPTNVDPNGDNDPDDATFVPLSDIGASKQINSAVEVTGSTGVFDVEYAVVIENTGTVDLTNVQVSEQLGGAAGHFGNGFLGVQTSPAIVSSSLSSGASLPTLTAWDGVANSDLFDGTSGLLRPGDSFVVTFTVRVDTVTGDTTAPFDFNNQIVATADGPASTIASDLSDFGTNPNGNNTDGSEDTPTPLQIPQIRSAKNHGAATLNPDGSYTVPVIITIANTGTVDMDSIQMTEDVANQFGDGFLAVQNPQILPVAPYAGVLPTLNAAWAGDTSQNVFSAAANSLLAGQSLTFTFDAIVDPDAVDDIAMAMSNQATVQGRGPNYDGALITVNDQSGNGVAVTSGVDNDDATPLLIPEVITQKQVIGFVPAASGTSGHIDATFSFTLTNSGTVPLVSPTLVDPWGTAYGAAFVAVVDTDLSDDVVTPPTTGIGGNSSYSGAVGQNMLDGAGQLLPGESVTVTITIEIDPDANPAAITSGNLTNQATGSATYDPDPFNTGDEIVVGDLSDDPNDPANVDPDTDGDPDDPTALTLASLDVTKAATAVAPAASGTPGNFDVTYVLTVTNTGTQSLANLSLTDDLATQFGGALIDIVSVSVTNIDADTPPVANPAFDGTAGSDLLLGAVTDQLAAGQSFRVAMIVEVDPDNPAAITNANGQLSNAAVGGGDGENGDAASDVSDDPADLTNFDANGDNNPDDATTLAIGSLQLTKAAGPVVPASSGADGNFDVTYTFTLRNTGNDDISALSINDDWATEFGGAFVRVVDQNLSDDVAGSVTVTGNATYTGGAAENLFAVGSLLGIGETVTVDVTVELDPDALTANLVGGQLLNSATARGTSTLGTVDDRSDDPADLTNADTDGDNTPDDRTGVSVADIALTKSVFGLPVPAASGTTGNYDVTLRFRFANSGSEALSNLTLTDDLASQFGGAFVAIRGISLTNINAAAPPTVNSGFDGTAGSDMLLGSAMDDLRSGQSFDVMLTIEVDPNNPTGVFSGAGALLNSATAGGTGELGTAASDVSDDPSNATNVDPDGDNNPDDPTTLRIADLNVTKTAGSATPANQVVGSTGAFGNFVVPYTITIANTGNDLVTALSLVEDLATQFGGGLVGIVGTPILTLANISGTAVASPNPSTFDGNTTTEILDVTVSRLGIEDQLTVTLQVEIDPDSPTATLAAGALENSATASGTDSGGNPVSDDSDDPSNPTSDNDPTRFSVPALAVAKTLGSVVPAASGTTGNFDVSYALTFRNTGTEVIRSLSLLDDLASQFGGAFVDVVSVGVSNVNATNPPLANPAYDGTAASDLLIGSATDALEPGQSFQVLLTIEVDPDSPTGNFAAGGELANQALGQGTGMTALASSVSDNPADVSNVDDDADGQPDDPTTLRIGDLAVAKTTGNVNPASTVAGTTGTFGNFVVDYTLTIRNTGNDLITNLSLVEDFTAHFAGAFVGIIGMPSLTVTNNSGVAVVNANPAGFDGDSVAEMLDVATSQLGRGDEVAVTIRVEIDPDAATANLIGGTLQNSAVAGGTDSTGNPVSDLSDDPANPTSDNDPTPFSIADLAVTKTTTGVVPATSGTVGNYDVTYQFTFVNSGTEELSNLSLTDNLAGQFGGAFVGVVSVGVTNVDAATPPTANGSYDGTAGSDLLSGAATDSLLPGQSFTVTLVVEVDPDSATGNFNGSGQLENSATASAAGATGTTSSASDDPTDGTNEDSDADGQPDDETTLAIGDLRATKTAGAATPSNQFVGASGAFGNFVVPYTLTIRNTGNDLISGLSAVEDLATQLGGAFIGVVGTPVITPTNTSGNTSVAANSTPFNGSTTTELLNTATSQLGIGDSVTITINVEIDPDAATANLIGGTLQNSAVAGGTDSTGNPVSDLSDDPANPTSDNDPTPFSIADLAVTKTTTGVVPATSGTVGNYDVTYQFTFVNSGTEELSNLSLTDNLAGQFGGAFVGVVSVGVTNVDAATPPTANGSYDGTAGSDLLSGAATDSLLPGQSFTVTLVVEVDPDSATGNFNGSGQLENSATASAAGATGTTSSASDDPTDGTNEDSDADGQPDDETTLAIGDLRATKTAGAATPSNQFVGASGAFGNFVVPYTLTIRNTGNDLISGLSAVEDLATQLGGAFIGVVGTPVITPTNTSGNTSVAANSTPFNGSTTTELLNTATSQLGIGDSVTITINVEIDPDAATANLIGGTLQNSAVAGGTDSTGNPVSDLSDDPANPTSDNDPTPFSIADLAVTKTTTGVVPATSGTVGNYDVTYQFTFVNSGTEELSNLSLTDNLAGQFGGAFVGVVSVGVTNVDAATPPTANGSYDGTAGSDLLSGAATDSLLPGQSFTVTLVVEVDPDSATGNFNGSGQLENSATASAAGATGTTSSASDDPTDGTNEDSDADGQPDDETTLAIGDLRATKTAGAATPSNQFVGASGAFGNFVVPYTLTIRNTGNDLISGLSAVEDLATQLGGAFIGVVGTPVITPTNTSGNTSVAANSTPFNGSTTTELLNTATSQLGIGDSVTITINVEIDPDAATANLIGGTLQNSAVAGGTDSTGNPVSDLSDDPANPTSDNDPTPFSIADLAVTKTTTGVVPATSGTVGNYDVTYQFTFVNSGTEELSNLSLTDNLAGQFGGAFVGVVSVGVTNVDAATPPTANGSYDGTAGSDLLSGAATDSLLPGQSFTVTLVVEVDPDSATGNFNGSGQLENSATASAAGATGTTSSASDDPTDGTNEDSDADGQPDDETTLAIGDLRATKTAGAATPSNQFVGASGAFGNFVVPYTLTIRNTGNDLISGLSAVEDLATQLGGAFIGVVGTPVITPTNTSGNTSVAANSTPFNGSTTTELLNTATSQLGIGDSVTITINVEIDPDAATANLIGGTLQNSAVAGGTDSTGNPVSDLSDDPANPTSDNDPTPFSIADLAVTKTTTGVVPATSGTVGNYDVTYQFTFVNSGTEELSNLSLTDNLAGQFGGAFVGVVSVGVTNVDAATPPTANGSYDGTAGSDLLSGAATDSLLPGQSFTVTLVVEVDPDSATGNFNGSGQLENSATASAAGATGTTSSASDDPTDGTNEDSDADGQPDDETTLAIGNLSVQKVAVATTPANQFVGSTGTSDNFVITYTITVTNTGNSLIDDLQIEENLGAAFGGAFVGVVGTPTISVTNGSGASAANAAVPTYDGATNTQVLDATTSQLGIGDSIDITIRVEVDPDNPAAALVMGGLVNRATASGTDANGTSISDLSDDPSDPTDVDVDGDNDPDDATSVSISDLAVTKSLGSIVPAASGTSGNRDVTYVLTVRNTGTTRLQDLQLSDDLVGQFGGAFVRVVNVTVSPGTATIPPAANNGFDGTATSNMLLPAPAGQLDVGQSFQVTLIVEVDPDNAGATYDASGELANSATATADGPGGTISSDSDDPNDLADVDSDNDGSPDDETGLSIADLELTKAITNALPSASGTLGNIDVTYTLVLTNTGNQPLTNVNIRDDWAGQFGGAFVGVVDTNLSDGNVVAPGGSGIGGNATYTGGAAENMLNGAGSLAAGQSVTISVTVELDPDAATAVLNAAGRLENSAVATASSVSGMISDLSDDPADPADVDTEGDNDPDDGTVLSVSSIRATKEVSGVAPAASGTQGNFDVTYQFIVTNFGLVGLSSLSLTDDLATQMGGAFVGVVGVSLTNVDASTPPTVNLAFDGTTGSDMLAGSAMDDLQPGESFMVTLVIEVDPDNVSAVFDTGGDLANSGEVVGVGPDGATSSQTDNPNDPTDGDRDADGNPDDPTTLRIGHLAVEKSQVGSPVAAISGTEDHVDVTYDITISNTGNAPLTQLSLLEDLQSQMLGGFVRIVGSPSIVAGAATDLPEFDSGFDGGITLAELFDNSVPNTNRLDRGQSLTVRFVAELDPAAASGPIANQAVVSSIVPGDPLNPITDTSDDPTDPTDVDPDNDNDPDDVTRLRYPDISAAKAQVGIPTQASGDPSLYEVTFEIVVQNTGNMTLAGLDLYDDIAAQLGGGFVGVSSGPTISSHTLANAANLPSINGGWSADTSLSLFNDDGQLLAGERLTVRLTITVDPALVMSSGNQALAAADNPIDGGEDGVTDVSDSGSNPTSTNPGAPGDSGTASDVTPLFLPDATVGIAKSATVVGQVVTLRFALENTGNLIASNVRVIDNLNATFGAGNFVVNSISLTTAPSDVDSGLTINMSFDGATDTNLLDGSATNTLDVGDTAVISMQVTVNELIDIDGGGPLMLGEFRNSATTTSTDPVGNMFADDSVAGSDPDPDMNGDPTDNSGPTAIAVAVDATVGVAKDSVWNDLNDTVAYSLHIQNFGNTRALNLSIEDDLDAVFGAGNYTVSGLVVASGPASLMVNPGFNGSVDRELLGVGTTLGVGESGEIRFTVTVLEIADPQANGLGDYANSVTAMSVDGDGTVYADASVSGTDPDPDMDGNPTNNASANSGSLTPDATVGAAKSAAVTFAPTVVTIDVYLEHFGNTQALVGVREDLTAVFGAGTYSVNSLLVVSGPATLATNPGFNGGGNTELIAAGSSMQPGETAQIRLVIGLNLTSGVYNNQVFVTATDTDGTTYLDASVSGTDADPDNNQSPSNDRGPTRIIIGDGTITGRSYIDVNNDGLVGATEVGIPAVTIELNGVDLNGTSVTRTTTTGAGGIYAFTGLPMGNFVIRQVQPSAYIDGRETAGNYGGDTSVNDQISVALTAYGPQFVATGYNFAEIGVDPFGGGKDPFLGSQQPAVIVVGDTLFVTGTAGDDDLQITAGLAQHTIHFGAATLTYDAQSIRNIRVFGNGGRDRVEMFGAVGADRVVLFPNSASMTHESYEIRLSDVDHIVAHGDAGRDTAFLVDSPGRDVFLAGSSYATMRDLNNVYKNETFGFEIVTGNAVMGGNDIATIYDGAGDDQVRIVGDFGQMIGTGAELRANKFEALTVRRAVGGSDRVEFVDSPGDEEYTAYPRSAVMQGAAFRNRVEGFVEILAVADKGGFDTAAFYDGTGDDAYSSWSDRAVMQGATYRNSARGFEVTSGYAVAGGHDTAELHDSAGNDVLVARGTYTELRGAGFKQRALGFDTVRSFAGQGGYDAALLFDTSGDDVFRNDNLTASIWGNGYENVASGFEQVQAKSEMGGHDTAEFDSVTARQLLMGRGSMAQVTGAGRNAMATGFAFVRAIARTNETAHADVADVDYVFSQLGSWG